MENFYYLGEEVYVLNDNKVTPNSIWKKGILEGIGFDKENQMFFKIKDDPEHYNQCIKCKDCK